MNCIIFLKQNAEWISAIALMFFGGIQVFLSRAQTKQELWFKRLELAQNLNQACTHFPNNKKECNKIMDWLLANQISFIFLLPTKAVAKYWALYSFIIKLTNEPADYFEDLSKRDKFYELLTNLDTTLMKPSCSIKNTSR